MPIVSSSVFEDRPQNDGRRRVREEHVDSIGKKHYLQYQVLADYDASAGLITGAETVNKSLASSEIVGGIAEYEAGTDPLHDEISAGNWQKITPLEQTWDSLAAAVTISFLERADRNQLRYLETIIVRISTQDKKVLWGMTNQEVTVVNSEIQAAVNAQVELDAYTPFFIGGVKV